MTEDGRDSEQHPPWIRSTIDRYERPLLLYARKLLGDADRARDVVQETFLQLCAKDREQLNGTLVPWLYTVCRSRAIDVRRKEKRMTLASEESIGSIVSPAPGPDDDAEQTESADCVQRLIGSLPPNQQEVLRLKFQHALSYREIAKVTGLSETNVGFLIHTGLKSVREQMQRKR